MMLELEKCDSRNDVTFIFCNFVINQRALSYTAYWKFNGSGGETSLAKSN